MDERVLQEIERRKSSPPQVFISFFMAALANHGVLRQGMVDLASADAAEKCFKAFVHMGLLKERYKSSTSGMKEFLHDAMKALNISDDFEVVSENNKVELRIKLNSCRYCPKGIGGAEIPGTLCPFYRLLETMANCAGILCRATQKPLRKFQIIAG